MNRVVPPTLTLHWNKFYRMPQQGFVFISLFLFFYFSSLFFFFYFFLGGGNLLGLEGCARSLDKGFSGTLLQQPMCLGPNGAPCTPAPTAPPQTSLAADILTQKASDNENKYVEIKIVQLSVGLFSKNRQGTFRLCELIFIFIALVLNSPFSVQCTHSMNIPNRKTYWFSSGPSEVAVELIVMAHSL